MDNGRIYWKLGRDFLVLWWSDVEGYPKYMSTRELDLQLGSGGLKNYFFEGLQQINKKSLCPVPEEAVFYSSELLDRFSLSENFFDIKDGKVNEKILGLKLMEADHSDNIEKQKRLYREIGDTTLFVSGYFSKSLDTKLFDTSYYISVGQTAYRRLNQLVPNLLNVPEFYRMLATCYENLAEILKILSEQDLSDPGRQFVVDLERIEDADQKALLIRGILIPDTKKCS